MSIKRRIEVMEKILAAESFSAIPKVERVVVASGHTPEERSGKMSARMAEMHKKYGDFDESYLTQIFIRKFSKASMVT